MSVATAKAAIEKIRDGVSGAAEVSLKTLATDGMADKAAERVHEQFCGD